MRTHRYGNAVVDEHLLKFGDARTGESAKFLAFLNDDEGGKGGDVVVHRGFGHLVDVDFIKSAFFREQSGEVVHRRCDDPTGRAPSGRKVQNHNFSVDGIGDGLLELLPGMVVGNGIAPPAK